MCRTTSYRDHYPAHLVTPSSRGGIDRSLRSVSSFRPFTSEQRGKYHFNTGGGSSLATPLLRPGTTAQNSLPMAPSSPPELRKIGSNHHKEKSANDNRSGNEDATIVIDDDEEQISVETCNKSTSGSDNKKESTNICKGGTTNPSLPSHLSGSITRKPRPKSCTGRVSSASRVMAQQHKLPLLEDKNLRFPPLNLNNDTWQMNPQDLDQNKTNAYLWLAPKSDQTIGEMVTPPSLRMKRGHTHHSSLPSPRQVGQSLVNTMQSSQTAPKQPSQAQIVKQFTRNLQRELYCSPDMRGVTMKEGKKHTFFGHHGHDFH